MAVLKIESFDKKIHLKNIAQAVYETLNQTENLKAEIVFHDASEMQKLNAEARGVDKVTDVLSFPTLDGVRGKVIKQKDFPLDTDGKYTFIGSIVLCSQKIIEQAKEYGNTEKQERDYLIIHGLLHLFGYDHEIESDKAEMRKLEKEILLKLGRKDD